jgi:hypothetical protein
MTTQITASTSSSFGAFVHERRKALAALALGVAMTLAALGGIQPASAATLVPVASHGGSGATAGVTVDVPANVVFASTNHGVGPSAF